MKRAGRSSLPVFLCCLFTGSFLYLSCSDQTSYVPAALEAGASTARTAGTQARQLTELSEPGPLDEASGSLIPSQDEADAMARAAIDATNFEQELARLETEIRAGSGR